MPHILSLPSELLTQIFTHLNPDNLMLFCPSKDPDAHFSTWGTAGHLVLPTDPYAASLLVCKQLHDIVMPLVKSSTVAFCSLPCARMGLKKFRGSRADTCKVVQTRYFTPEEASGKWRPSGAFEGGGAEFNALWLDEFTYAGLPFEVRAWRWLDRHDTLGISNLSRKTVRVVWRLEFVAGQSDEGAVKRGYRKCVCRYPESDWHQGVSSWCYEGVEERGMHA